MLTIDPEQVILDEQIQELMSIDVSSQNIGTIKKLIRYLKKRIMYLKTENCYCMPQDPTCLMHAQSELDYVKQFL